MEWSDEYCTPWQSIWHSRDTPLLAQHGKWSLPPEIIFWNCCRTYINTYILMSNNIKSGTWSTFGYSSQIFFTQVGQRSNFSQTGIVLTHWHTLGFHSCSSTTSLLIIIKVSGIFEHTLNLILCRSEDNSGRWISITIEVLGLNVNFIRWVRTKVFQYVRRLSSNFCVFNASSGSWLNSRISYSIAINGFGIFCKK